LRSGSDEVIPIVMPAILIRVSVVLRFELKRESPGLKLRFNEQ
jgi:hypothetical protein